MSQSFFEIAEDCLAASGFDSNVREAAASDIVVACIQQYRLADLVYAYQSVPSSELRDEDRPIFDRASASVFEIRDDIENQCLFLQNRLAEEGIVSDGDVEGDGRGQFHGFSLDVPQKSLGQVLSVLAEHDYPMCGGLSAGAVAALAATRGELDLQHESANMVLTLRWPSGFWAGFGKFFKPSLDHLTSFSTGKVVWPVYLFTYFLRNAFALFQSSGPDDRTPKFPVNLSAAILESAQVSDGARIVVIGCGDGRFATVAARDFGAWVTGFDADAQLAEKARTTAKNFGVEDRVSIKDGEFLPGDLSDADVVFLFLAVEQASQDVNTILSAMPKGGRLVMQSQKAIPVGPTPDRVLPVFGASSVGIVYIWEK